MFTVQRSLSVLVFSGLLVAGGPALAADEPVATADPNTPSVAAQIDDYLKTSPAVELPKDTATGITPGEEEPRKVHGVVEVAVGTHGYRSAYVRSDFPIGKTGTLSIAVEDTQFNGRFGGYGYGGFGSQPYRNQNLALGLAFGGAAQDGADGRCRDASGLRRHRIDPMLTGPIDSDRAYACDRRDAPPEGR
jgi:hypothetical protein